ncbi:MAG: hypothetical protein LBF76_00065 [Holosporales bacterium]|jgi:hypothetical protein|nr:hypothetical protein [Holosporales bacterium]
MVLALSEEWKLFLARLCHDLSAPIGTISLASGALASSKETEAIHLLFEAQQKLSARLKLFRLLSLSEKVYSQYAFAEVQEGLSAHSACLQVSFSASGFSEKVPTFAMKFLITAALVLLPSLVRKKNSTFLCQQRGTDFYCIGQGEGIVLSEEARTWFLNKEKNLSAQTIFCALLEDFAQASRGTFHLEQTSEGVTLSLCHKASLVS